MSEPPNADQNPGSPEAIARGCTCPVLDNGHGRGYMGQAGIFVLSGDCPMHGLGSDWGKGNPPLRAGAAP